jgi:hypothetical protein
MAAARIVLGLVATSILVLFAYSLFVPKGRGNLGWDGLALHSATKRPHPEALSQGELAGEYRGQDSWLHLKEAGGYEYSGSFRASSGCPLLVPRDYSVGRWTIELDTIVLDSEGGTILPTLHVSTLFVRDSADGTRLLIPQSGGFMIESPLRRRSPR